MPFTRGKKNKEAAGNKASRVNGAASENQEEATQVKRSSSPPHGAPKKRTAFIDITNAHKVTISLPGRKRDSAKKVEKKTNSASVLSKNQTNLQKSSSVSSEGSPAAKERSDVEEKKNEEPQKDDSSLAEEPVDVSSPAAREVPAHIQRQPIPEEFDIDSDNSEDCYMCPEYAKDIFDYLKKREEKFVLSNYMDKQPYLSPDMRAILIDWLVEVQENFELFHETLYLAVKLTDHYLSKVPIHRDLLQLVGSTALLIACKFEERCPPPVEDFLYICDDAYKRRELIGIEANILKTLSFDINIPIPYRFLRRYARCVNAGMDTLTLARFFCEMSLMEIDFVEERGSRLASACLLMALVTKNLGGWCPILQFHSGYQVSDFKPVVRKLHSMLQAPSDDNLKTIRNKYSHKVFFEVASLPLVDINVLEKALASS
ncbi:G2/mitotic-specific cyclin-B3 [Poecilia reticulata]|uniref:G2/mitotic-specific cyclin-B2 n=1 Tax=Poecilia reticulata TaxID=8081 RepID=A0A3P9P026_POERE|nr:PREDICTED: G2/mitotic-specific cyclin-B3 [Poecilia reticulata]XP_008433560.1 PREDICTED: G2/mitotic-specific cyclin-B3 [Poecilia reticulata]